MYHIIHYAIPWICIPIRKLLRSLCPTAKQRNMYSYKHIIIYSIRDDCRHYRGEQKFQYVTCIYNICSLFIIWIHRPWTLNTGDWLTHSTNYRFSILWTLGLKVLILIILLRSRSIFLDFVLGKFGHDLIDDYLKTLNDFKKLTIPSVAQVFFTLGLQAMAENFRRFVHPTQAFPYMVFRLLDTDHDGFVAMCKQFKAKQQSCHCCVDIDFTSCLLEFIDVTTPDRARYSEKAVKDFLFDLSVHAPISSDLVECLHGFSQHVVHRWRGVRPSDPTAQERTLWTLITKAFGRFKKWMWDRFGDRHSGHRLFRFGTTSSNQYSKKTSLPQTLVGPVDDNVDAPVIDLLKEDQGQKSNSRRVRPCQFKKWTDW